MTLESDEPSPGACITHTWCESATGKRSPYETNLTEDEALACAALVGSMDPS